MRKKIGILIIFINLVFISNQLIFSGSDENKKILSEMEKSLQELLEIWYPLTVDSSYGGFLSDFNYKWEPDGPQNKMLVTQARQLWTTSEASLFYDDSHYAHMAEHGFLFLKNTMWDDTYEGFYLLVNRQGEPIKPNNMGYKSTYSTAFVIYALVSYFRLSQDSTALDLAKKTFVWLENHSHDPEFKGYFDHLNRDGTLPDTHQTSARTGVRWKDQNTSIHLLEAFTVLYKVWPDPLVRERLKEIFTLVRDTIVTSKGYLTLFFKQDWTPISFRDSSRTIQKANYLVDHVSFGHDVETAYLLLEASHALGRETDAKTLSIAKKMVDNALAKGWDNDKGGFYDAGYYFADTDTITIMSDKKVWWVQAEGLNALLLMSKLFPQDKKYYKAFEKQWNYIKNYMIDAQYGGWYAEGLDKSPQFTKAPKAYDWKVNYHNFRTLRNCIQMLKSSSSD